MNTYWISLPCDLLSSLASFQCSLLHRLHLSSDLGLSKYVNQHSHLNLSRNVRLPVLYDLDFNSDCDVTCALPARAYPTRFYQRAHPTHIYVSHATQILKNPPEYTMRNRVQSGRNTKNDGHAHLLGIA